MTGVLRFKAARFSKGCEVGKMMYCMLEAARGLYSWELLIRETE